MSGDQNIRMSSPHLSQLGWSEDPWVGGREGLSPSLVSGGDDGLGLGEEHENEMSTSIWLPWVVTAYV